MTSIAAVRRAGLAGAALAAIAGSIAVAAPSEAAPGVFRYQGYANLEERMTNDPPEPQRVMSPPAGECIPTPRGGNAENYTAGTVDLFRDAECKELASRVRPFGTNASPFEAIKAQS